MERKQNSGHKHLCKHVTGIILAGGSSIRFGQNKAFIDIDGIRLIDRIAEKMKNIFEQVILVSNEKERYEYIGIPVIEDLIKGLGPIGGIYTGLMSISNQAGFFIACDMPFVNKQLIRYMVDVQDNHAAVVPMVADNAEPLHAIYSKSCLGTIKKLIDSNAYQIRLSYEKMPVRYIKEDEIKKFCVPSKAFSNINTPDALRKIQSLIKILDTEK